MSLPLKTASVIKKVVWSWNALWFESEGFEEHVPSDNSWRKREKSIFSQVSFTENKNLLTYTVTLASELDSWTAEQGVVRIYDGTFLSFLFF